MSCSATTIYWGLYGKEKAVQYINNNRARIQNKEAIQGDYGVAKEGDGEMYQ